MNALQNVGKYNPDGRGPLYFPGDANTPAGWRGDVCFLCQVNDYTVPANPKPVNGFFLWVGLPNQDPNLIGNKACWIAADRDKAIANDPTYLVYNTLTPAQQAAYRITPVMLGAQYPFQER